MNDAIFYTFIGAAAVVAALALLFGSPQKVYGAATIVIILIASNLTLALYRLGVFGAPIVLVAFAIMDAAAAFFFARIYAPRALQKNRWAAFAAAMHAIMFGANATAIAVVELQETAELFIVLNILSVAVMAACLIAFIPKSWAEARDVLAVKLFFIKTDLFRLQAHMNRKAATNRVDAHIGEKMRVARIVKGLTREELGAALGVSGQQVERYEKAMNRVSASTLLDASKVLSVEVSYFFEGVDDVNAAGLVVAFPNRGRAHGKP